MIIFIYLVCFASFFEGASLKRHEVEASFRHELRAVAGKSACARRGVFTRANGNHCGSVVAACCKLMIEGSSFRRSSFFLQPP